MVFNVGSGKETSVNDLIRHIELVFERKLNVEHLESRDEIRKIVSNVDQINNYIGWRPRSSMNSGLKDVQKWLQNTL
jgi:UDP-glucose 4-epimerase